MASWTFFATLFTQIIALVQAATNAMLTDVLGYVRGPLMAGSVLWIAFQAFLVAYRGAPMISLIRGAIRIAAITAALQSVGSYNQQIGDLARTIPREASNAISGNTANFSEGAAFDTLANKAVKAGLTVYDHIPSLTLKAVPLAIGVLGYTVFAFLLIVATAVILLFSIVALFLMLAVGPFFVALYPFGALRRFADGWFAAVASMIVTQVLAVAVLGMLIGIEASTIDTIIRNTGSINVADEMVVLLQGAALFWVVYQIVKQAPGFASRITGGVYQGMDAAYGATIGVASGVMRAGMGAAGGAARAAGAAGAQVAAQGARSAGQSMGIIRPPPNRSLSGFMPSTLRR